MFKSTFIFVIIGVVSYIEALSLDELKQKYVEIIMKCSDDYPITGADLEQLKTKIMPDNKPVKCLFACVYKKAGMMNENGDLWIEGVNDIARKYLSHDPVKMKKSEEFTQACKHVNDVPVSDGNSGCERAALIFRCTVEKAPDFDFV